jgi:hypothetical protein
VIFSLGFLVAFLVAVPLRADYLINRLDGKTIKTQDYWIQGKKVYFDQGRETTDVYEVKYIIGQDLTKEEVLAHGAAMDALHKQVLQLLSVETDLAVIQGDTLKKISEFPVGKKNAMSKGEKKAFRAGLKAQKEKVVALLGDWRDMKLPEMSLIKMRDIKSLQLLSLEASLDQALKYVDKNDPTYFEYAKANLAQYATFESNFREALPWK